MAVRSPTPAALLLLLFFFSVLSLAAAEIKDLKIESDSRPLILFEKFGFAPGGVVSVSVHDVAVSPASTDPSLLGFFLLSDESLIQALYDSSHHQSPHPTEPNSNPSDSSPLCVLSSIYVQTVFTFNDFLPSSSSFNRSFVVPHPDEYSLYFANCAPAAASVSMSVHTDMFNPGRGPGARDYISVGRAPLPALYSVFALAYFAFLAAWAYACLANRLSAHRIHLLMAGLLLAKALNLVAAAEDHHYIRTTGTPHGWDVLFYLFQFLKGVLLFTVIVLIGTGWSFLKPFLQDREKRVLMFVVPLQVLANLASAVIGETGPFIKDWVTWNQLFLLIDVACCCAILFPIVWSIRSLREASKTDGKAARNLSKLTLFRKFYISVVGYLYFTRIVVFALRTIAAYKYQWVSVAAEEAASLAFYTYMFYMFRPVERNQYFALDDDEEEAAQAVLREEEFEL